MCGIVGYVGKEQAASILLEGLHRLEYRGYDSAGIGVLNGHGIELHRSVGKLGALETLLQGKAPHGKIGLGHTRWATHGRPTEENAHPHISCNDEIAVVHNGIIENYSDLKKRLEAAGHTFSSQTDTEVLAHLIEASFQGDPLDAVRKALKVVKGSYAIGVMFAHDKNLLIAARKDSPLVLGFNEKGVFLASDVPALLSYTKEFIPLEDGEIAMLTENEIRLMDQDGNKVDRKPTQVLWDHSMAEKGGHSHYMKKEIFEQAETTAQTLRDRIFPETGGLGLESVFPSKKALDVSKIALIGCGTSYHAALVGRYWLEEIAGVPCSVDVASESRYRHGPAEPGTLIVAISQSGETADTLAALRSYKLKGMDTLAICNVPGSTITREAEHALYTHCGPEIGVASTKAFTGQLTALFLLTLHIALCKGKISPATAKPLLEALAALPQTMRTLLNRSGAVASIAKQFHEKPAFVFLGRHLNYPVALEGALKLKEISYIHAEGYPAGELKHGPIAVLEDGFPVVAIATASAVREKVISNIEEVKARGAKVVAIATDGDAEVEAKADQVLWVPKINEYLAPLLTVLPLQLLAYEIALLRGKDVDQPRNLAKSVTVE